MNSLLSELKEFINTNYSPEEKVKTSKDGGESTFYRKGGKSLCYIETKDGKSMVTVVLGASLKDKINSGQISQRTKKMFDNAKQYHDGKWLFFEIKTKEDVEDIKKLLTLKRKPL